MGAYENPRFFSVDYTAGAKAFNQAFQQGLAQGEQIFQQRQEARDEYKEGVYEEGAKLEAQLETLVGNAKMTAETMQDTLNEFYEFAFEKGERQKGLKGLFTPREENRIEGVQMKNYTNSFKSEYAAIKALSTVAGDVETIPSEDLDLGGEGQEKQLYYKSLQQEGRLKTNFKLVKGEGFEASFEVLDANGKPTGEVISSNDMNLAMNTDTRAARTEINNAWEKAYVQKEGDGSITANVQNKIDTKFTEASYNNEKDYFKAEGFISTEVDRTNGMQGYLNDNGDLDIKNEDGTYDFSKLPDISNVNNIYNNIVKASPGEKLAAFKAAFGDDHGLTDDQIDRVMDKAMKVGVGGLKNDRIVGLDGPLKIKEGDYDKIYGASLIAKHKLTRDYQIQAIKNNGVLDKFNKPEDTSTGDGGDGGGRFGDQTDDVNLAYKNIRSSVNKDFGNMEFSEFENFWKGKRFGKESRILGVRRATGPSYSPDDNNVIFTITQGTSGQEELPVINMNSVEGRNLLTRELVNSSDYGGAFKDDLRVLAEEDYDKEITSSEFSNNTNDLYNTLLFKYKQ